MVAGLIGLLLAAPTVATLRRDGHALGTMAGAVVDLVAAIDAAAAQEELGAIRIGVLHGIGVQVLIHIGHALGALAVVAPAHSVGLDRPGVFHPT